MSVCLFVCVLVAYVSFVCLFVVCVVCWCVYVRFRCVCLCVFVYCFSVFVCVRFGCFICFACLCVSHFETFQSSTYIRKKNGKVRSQIFLKMILNLSTLEITAAFVLEILFYFPFCTFIAHSEQLACTLVMLILEVLVLERGFLAFVLCYVYMNNEEHDITGGVITINMIVVDDEND